MKKFIAIYTTDNGQTTARAEVTAADYTKAYLQIIRDFLHLDIIIVDLQEAPQCIPQ